MPISKIVSRSLQHYWRISRGLTLEARGALIDAQGRLRLVRHPSDGVWRFPGGRVKQRETVADALMRELRTQLGVAIDGVPVASGIYAGTGMDRGNHVVLFVIRNWHAAPAARSQPVRWEHGVFAPDGLPAATCPATRRHILEIMGEAPPSPTW